MAMFLATVTGFSIPSEFTNPPTQTATPIESSTVETDMNGTSNYFTLCEPSAVPSNTAVLFWDTLNREAPLSSGRYFEGGYPLDKGILTKESQDDPKGYHPHDRALNPELILLDLSENTNETNDIENVMQHVAKSLAAQNTLVPQTKMENTITVIVYLLMAAIIVLVAIARK
jgi:hypothetical protein